MQSKLLSHSINGPMTVEKFDEPEQGFWVKTSADGTRLQVYDCATEIVADTFFSMICETRDDLLAIIRNPEKLNARKELLALTEQLEAGVSSPNTYQNFVAAVREYLTAEIQLETGKTSEQPTES